MLQSNVEDKPANIEISIQGDNVIVVVWIKYCGAQGIHSTKSTFGLWLQYENHRSYLEMMFLPGNQCFYHPTRPRTLAKDLG